MNEKNIKIVPHSNRYQELMNMRKYLMRRAMEDPNFTYTVPLVREQHLYQFDTLTGINPPVDCKVFYHEQGLSIETDADVIVLGNCEDYDSLGLLQAPVSTDKTILLGFSHTPLGNEKVLEHLRYRLMQYQLHFANNTEGFMQYFDNILAEKKDTKITPLTIDEIIARSEVIYTPEEEVYKETYRGIDVFYSADRNVLDNTAVGKLRGMHIRDFNGNLGKISVLSLHGTSARIYTMENGDITIKDKSNPYSGFIEEFLAYPKEQQGFIIGQAFHSGSMAHKIDTLLKNNQSARKSEQANLESATAE